ncbi:MAG: glycosyltransferase [Planctomycetota bacterium]|nr:glycosyltransferase [Planctomycetota bacterium]
MADRIRVALVITELNVGGAERCLVNLATGLDRTRFEPAVYSLAPRPAADRDGLVRSLDAVGVPVQFLGVTSVRQAFSATRRLRMLWGQQQPHLVQSFLFHANVVATLAAQTLPGICIVTGIRVADPTRWRQWLERWISRRVQRIVCVSRSVADFCQQAGLPAEKLVVVSNGIETSAYPASGPASLSALGIKPDRQIIACVARLHPQKGVDWLLSFSRRWLDQLPHHDLLLVGDGPQRQALQQMAVSLGIDARVHFTGWRPDVPQILAASALLVLPSRWEGMPNVMLEAMATALPIVAVRTQGVDELLGPLAEPQSVALGDRDGFVAKLVRVGQDAAEAAELGRRNRERVIQHFSLSAMVAAYERLYLSSTRS